MGQIFDLYRQDQDIVDVHVHICMESVMTDIVTYIRVYDRCMEFDMLKHDINYFDFF